MAESTIILARKSGLYRVEIVPPLDGKSHAATYASHKAAMGFAVGLRMTHRLPIRDMTVGGAT